MSLKAIIFDMYGVIMKDPYGGLMPYVNQYFPTLKYNDVYPLWVKASLGETDLSAFWSGLGFDQDSQTLEKLYLDGIEMDTRFGLIASALKERYKLALLTNDIAQWSLFLREKFDLDRYFDCILVSGEIGVKKPNPRIYAMALERLQLPAADCLFVDDRAVNLKAASKLGIHTVQFHRDAPDVGGQTVGSFDALQEYIAVMDK